jgi:CRP-like cAMP-binding protein
VLRYIVKKGIVGVKGRVLHPGMYFGEDFLLSQHSRTYSVQTLSYVDCMRIDRDDVYNVLESGVYPVINVSGLSDGGCCFFSLAFTSLLPSPSLSLSLSLSLCLSLSLSPTRSRLPFVP